MGKSGSRILCVDLDGTLILSDALFETAVAVLRKNPLRALLFPFWLLGGKARFKRRLSSMCGADDLEFPFSEDVVSYVRGRVQSGAKAYLATASDSLVAGKIADRLGFFEGVFASDGAVNLKGAEKAAFLEEMFGTGNFSYIGNDSCDIDVWKVSDGIVLANCSKKLEKKVRSEFPSKEIEVVGKPRRLSVSCAARLMRVHQWAKNLLVFVPLIVAHKYSNPGDVFASILAFVSFCLCASGTYIINDILDAGNDRRHCQKRFRPVASGEVSFPGAALAAAFLLFLGLLPALFLPEGFRAVLAAYTALTFLYSAYIKKKVLLDVMCLAILYNIRIYAGIHSIVVEISFWLFAFSLFIFLSLAFLKRFVEIRAVGKEVVRGRGYAGGDREIIAVLGTSSGLISALIFIMYIENSAHLYYGNSNILLLGVLPIIFFICRIWIRAFRGEVDSDPVLSAVKDPANYLLILIMAALFLASGPL